MRLELPADALAFGDDDGRSVVVTDLGSLGLYHRDEESRYFQCLPLVMGSDPRRRWFFGDCVDADSPVFHRLFRYNGDDLIFDARLYRKVAPPTFIEYEPLPIKRQPLFLYGLPAGIRLYVSELCFESHSIGDRRVFIGRDRLLPVEARFELDGRGGIRQIHTPDGTLYLRSGKWQPADQPFQFAQPAEPLDARLLASEEEQFAILAA